MQMCFEQIMVKVTTQETSFKFITLIEQGQQTLFKYFIVCILRSVYFTNKNRAPFVMDFSTD